MKLKIGTKLGLGFAGILLLMVVSGTLSYVKSTEVKNIYSYILSSRVPSIGALDELKDDLDYSGVNPGRLSSQPARPHAGKMQSRPGTVLGRGPAKAPPSSMNFPRSGRFRKIRNAWRKSSKESVKIREMQKGIIDSAGTGSRDAVVTAGNNYVDQVTPVLNATTKTLGDLSESMGKTLNEQQDKLDAANSSLVWSIGVSTALALAVGIFLAIFLSRPISSAPILFCTKRKPSPPET